MKPLSRAAILFFISLISYFCNLFADQTDSLQVTIKNTQREVGSIRFVQRDTNNLILRVMDKDGNAIDQLSSDQIAISRGNEQAKIIKVTPLQATVETNLNVVLALDNSASMSGSVKELLSSVQLLLSKLRDKSRISVVMFDETEEKDTRFTGQIDNQKLNVRFSDFYSDIQKAMDFIRWNYRSKGLTSRTYLYDMMLVGLKRFEGLPQNLLKVMVVFSDGQDLGSQFPLNRVVKEAATAGVPIYGVDYSDSRELNEILRRVVTAGAGGKVFRAEKAGDLMPVFDAISKEIITEFQVTYRFPVAPSGKIIFQGDSLFITARQIVDEFPMLNYVFFDSNSAEIDDRYHLFPSPDETRDFDETKIQQPLEKYYHLLNVIGSRARSDSTAKLTITGCNMNTGAEQNNLALSRQRAEAVSRYLQNIWGIQPSRITIRAQNLPNKRSSLTTPEGQAENRRVEITSNQFAILRPIRSEITEFVYRPEIGVFTTEINAPEGLQGWEFAAYHDQDPLIKILFDQPKTSINWNWIDLRGQKIRDLDHIEYAIRITDHDGNVFNSPRYRIPIVQKSEAAAQIEAQQDTLFEKFSLMLFDFNSAQLSESNQYLMQRVFSRFQEHPNATIRVLGYCDDIGSEEYNLKLSTDRAKMAYNTLKQMRIPAERLSFLGYGELNPLFSNATPEGRFLNRTVQIQISYPKANQ